LNLILSPLAAALVAVMCFFAGIAQAADSDIVSTRKNLHIYAGNTAVGTSPSGRKFRVFYGKDGTVAYSDSKGLSQTGKWIVTDDGMMCYDWRRWKDRCYSHKKDGDTFQSYRDGKTKGSRFVMKKGNVKLQK
jgi:hypothetical protein